MKALHADPVFKAARAARKASTIERNIEKLKAKLLAARKDASGEN